MDYITTVWLYFLVNYVILVLLYFLIGYNIVYIKKKKQFIHSYCYAEVLDDISFNVDIVKLPLLPLLKSSPIIIAVLQKYRNISTRVGV